MPVTATANTYATWDNTTNTYATLEATPTYGILEGARLLIQHTLPSSGSLVTSRARMLVLGGTLAPSGALPSAARTLRRTLIGALSSSGIVLLGKIYTRTVTGSLASSGVVSRVRQRLLTVAGALTSSGVLSLRQLQRVYIQLDGRLGSYGRVRFSVRRGPWPPLSPSVPASGAPPLVGAGSSTAPPLAVLAVSHRPTLAPSTRTRAPELRPATTTSPWPPFRRPDEVR